MPHTWLCFVWHMHQPFYKDLATGEYQLPWTRLHALKDYYGMVNVLKDFPDVHQTFNLVPSMMVQIEEYAAAKARDPFLNCALKPAEELSVDEQEFVLRYFFQANIPRMIYRYPRYKELWEAWCAAQYNPVRARRTFSAQAFRDLQVLSQVAWFDEDYLAHDPEVKALVAKGRDFSRDDQSVMARKQLEIVGKVLPVYREFAAKGQVELSITPYYHPILPLVCDSSIASVSHPNVQLPQRFQYPEDAREQIQRARKYAEQKLGKIPAGMWPSEGSVSDEALALAADCGVKWMATDNGVLGATLQRIAGTFETYQPYEWRKDGRSMKMIFRDHYLSDLIGFVYSRMDAVSAAQHFMDRIEENCRPILASGRDALIPIVLDGENAWEHYEGGGRSFLRELYRRISDHGGMTAVTVSELFERMQPAPLDHIFPGSWINANFDIWIGFDEDNRAWDLLLRARQTYDQVMEGPDADKLTQAQKELAYEELLIAEGSDWCWWYGPHHHSENRPEFDKLFREHLAQVYRALNRTPPEELSQPILKVYAAELQEPPNSLIRPTIDGQVTSYFEWMGGGTYAPDMRQGAMHGAQRLLNGLYYGSDGESLFIRLDIGVLAAGLEVSVAVESQGRSSAFRYMITETGTECLKIASARNLKNQASPIAAYKRVFEFAAPLANMNASDTQPLRFQIAVWRDGLPVDTVPVQGWIEFVPGEVGY